jgi:hypothetical protein
MVSPIESARASLIAQPPPPSVLAMSGTPLPAQLPRRSRLRCVA